MRAYSEDLRVRVVKAVEGGMPREEAVRVFGVSLATLKRWLQRQRTTGSVAARRPPGAVAVKTAGLAAALPARLATHGDATLAEHCAWWEAQSGHRVSLSTLWRAIAALKWTRKKKTKAACERDAAARAAWQADAATVDPRDLVLLDETGTQLGYTPTYAYAPRGQRAHATAPRRKGENRTILASLTADGLGPAFRLDGALTRDAFDVFICHRLAPTLRPGQVVVLDNLSAHHSARAEAAIVARDARLWFLPAYSPDFNPIELVFSKVKQALRRAQPRTDDDLRTATWAAFASVTTADIAGYYAHCGFPLQAQAA